MATASEADADERSARMKNYVKAVVVGTGVLMIGGIVPTAVSGDSADSQPAVDVDPPATTQPQPAPSTQPQQPPRAVRGLRG